MSFSFISKKTIFVPLFKWYSLAKVEDTFQISVNIHRFLSKNVEVKYFARTFLKFKHLLFTDLQLIKPILTMRLSKKDYEKPTPIQSQAIPHLLEGKDFYQGTAQTGTGKTRRLLYSYFAKIFIIKTPKPSN